MEKKTNKNISKLPNILTIIRLACIPFVAVLLSFPGERESFLAALCVGFAFITDMLDGFFARKYGAVTVLGKFLDPLADKILVCVTMIMLIPMERIPSWIVVIIIVREMAVTGLRSIAINEGVVIQAGSLGKHKTIFQSVALLGLCLHYEHFNINFHTVGMVFLWGALALTIWSGWDYFRQFRRVLLSANR